MVNALGDPHSLGYYRRVAERYPPQMIFEALGRVKKVARYGRVRNAKGALFIAIVKAACSDRGISLAQPEPATRSL